jgi:O-antigen/teichoic acid export membrane protein
VNLRRKTFSAVRWTTLNSATGAIVRIASIAVLARILVPEDYGLMAMVAVVLGIAELFADLGVNSAFVQRREVSLEERSSLFWLNVSMSTGVALVLVALSPLFARFFGDLRLTPLIMLSSTTFVITALGQQIKMSAEKELHFKAVVILNLIAVLISFVVAVVTALSGWGVYALVVSAIAKAAFSTLFYWLFVSDGWRPMWRLRLSDVRSFLGFGTATVANNVVNYVNRTIDVFLGGRLLGVTELGLFSVPRNLVLELSGMVNSIVTRVGFPLIAQIQSDVSQVRSVYLKTMNMTAATNAPLYIGISFFAPDIVGLLLGPGWERSGELLRILALWGGLRSTGNPVGSLLYGMGRAGLSLVWNLALLLIVPPVVWYGSLRGPEGIAWALLLLQAVLFVPAWFFLVRPLCRANLFDYSVSALRPFVLAALVTAPAFWAASWFEGNLLRVAIGVAIAAPAYFGISLLANREWAYAMLELIGRRPGSTIIQ